MIITMDMSSYEIEQDAMKIEDHGKEIMSAGRYPAIDLVCGLQEIEATPDVSSEIVAGMVLRKMYSYR